MEYDLILNKRSSTYQCRLCGRFDEGTLNIFTFHVKLSELNELNQDDGRTVPLSQLVNECLYVEVTKNADLPNYCCTQCYNQIISWLNFKTNCLNQQLKFRDSLKLCTTLKDTDIHGFLEGDNRLLKNVEEAENVPSDLFNGSNTSTKEKCINKKAASNKGKGSKTLPSVNGQLEENSITVSPKKVGEKGKEKKKQKKKQVGDFQCDICLKIFRTKLSIRKHLETHADCKKYCCHVCGVLLKTSACLRDHVKRHTTAKRFQCPHCPKQFHENNHLNNHIRTHTGEKPYGCKECDWRFTRSSQLNHHVLKVHKKEKKYTCKICGKEFLYNQHFKAHLMIHSGQKDAKCDVCQKTFVTKNALFRHQRLHTGDKPFSCPECGKRFADWSNRRKHLLTDHTKNLKNGQSGKSASTEALTSKVDEDKTNGNNMNDQSTQNINNKLDETIAFEKPFLNQPVILLSTVHEKSEEEYLEVINEDGKEDDVVNYPVELESLKTKESEIFVRMDSVLVLSQGDTSEMDLSIQDADEDILGDCQSDILNDQSNGEQVVLGEGSEFPEEDIHILDSDLVEDREEMFRDSPSECVMEFGNMDMEQGYLDLVENQQRSAANILSTIAPCETQAIIRMLNSQGTLLLFPEQYDLSQINETETAT